MAAREPGVIGSWNDREGRGIIRRHQGPDVVFSFSAIRHAAGGYLGLHEGLAVTFTLVETQEGYRAKDVEMGSGPDVTDAWVSPG
jgi:cold shock CspA family protein